MCFNFAVTSLRHIFRSKEFFKGVYYSHAQKRMWSLNVRSISHEPILRASTLFYRLPNHSIQESPLSRRRVIS